MKLQKFCLHPVDGLTSPPIAIVISAVKISSQPTILQMNKHTWNRRGAGCGLAAVYNKHDIQFIPVLDRFRHFLGVGAFPVDIDVIGML